MNHEGNHGLWAAVFVLLAFIVLAFVRTSAKTFIPNEDTGVFYLDGNTPEGTSLPITEDACKQATEAVLAVDGVKSVVTCCGAGNIGGAGENQAVIQVVLKDWSERKDPSLSLNAIMARCEAAVATIPSIRLSAYADPTVPGLGTMNGVSLLVWSTKDEDPVALAKEVHRLETLLRQSPLFDLVVCGYTSDSPHLRVVIDRAKCELFKVPLMSLYEALQQNLGSVYVNDVNLGTQVNRVTVEAEAGARSQVASVRELFVRSETGEMVPVSALATFEEESGPQTCNRFNQFVYCNVSIVPRDGVSTGDAIAETARIVGRNISPDYNYGWGDMTFHEMRTKGNGFVLVLLALLVVFLVYLCCWESLLYALLALVLPIAPAAGVMIALACSGEPLTLYVQIAIAVMSALAFKVHVLVRFGAKGVMLALGAFALGCVPFILATGVHENALRSIGVSMIGASVGLLMLCKILQCVVPWLTGSFASARGRAARSCVASGDAAFCQDVCEEIRGERPRYFHVHF